jgi:hypothetical protein
MYQHFQNGLNPLVSSDSRGRNRETASLAHVMLGFMDTTIRRFDSLTEADEAELDYYAGLTPEERLTILFELIAAYQDGSGEDSAGFERVYRIDELEWS